MNQKYYITLFSDQPNRNGHVYNKDSIKSIKSPIPLYLGETSNISNFAGMVEVELDEVGVQVGTIKLSKTPCGDMIIKLLDDVNCFISTKGTAQVDEIDGIKVVKDLDVSSVFITTEEHANPNIKPVPKELVK